MRYLLSIIVMAACLGTAYSDSEITGAAVAPARVSAELFARALAIIDKDNARVTDIFKDIHQNPELGFMKERTVGIVAREPESLGFNVKTGVLGVLRNGDGPTMLYRAGMDANAVEEMTGVPYASKVRV